MNSFPKIIEFQFHNLCNANCIICPYSDVKERKGFMDELLFEQIITEVGDKEILLIPYLNNEPFLDSSYCEKIKKINNYCPNAKIEISTNLSKVNEKVIQKLCELNIYELRISFFAYSKVYYEKMMPGLCYEKVWSNLEKILASDLKNKISKISITMIEHEYLHASEFDNMKDLCTKNGIGFNKWGYLDRAGNNTKFSNRIYKKNIKACEQKRPLERMHILYDGTVILCCQDWRREVVIGNLRNNTIQDIWMGDRYQELRSKIYDEDRACIELCKRCKLAVSN